LAIAIKAGGEVVSATTAQPRTAARMTWRPRRLSAVRGSLFCRFCWFSAKNHVQAGGTRGARLDSLVDVRYVGLDDPCNTGSIAGELRRALTEAALGMVGRYA
jgi:hypothetical protein